MIGAKKIGKKIDQGSDQTVYLYGDEHVIKLSFLSTVLGSSFKHKLTRDYRICRKYFKDYAVETAIVETNGSKRYAEIQPYIDGDYLGVNHLQKDGVRKQFDEILAASQTMKADGHPPVDLIGHKWRNKRLGNILVDESNRLHIVDATLFETQSIGLHGHLATPAIYCFKKIQTRLIQHLLAEVE